MKKINLELNKEQKYVVACSFGPDSMALLYSALKNGLNLVVAHVNYHKRDVSNFEEKSLRKFCAQNKLPIEVLDTTGLEPTKNFQEWARELRYKFFADIAKKYEASAVLVAHQEDDLIETYLMQKNRGNIVKNRGIAEEIDIFGVKIIRPLLRFSKQFLKEFDEENNVPYSVDISNLSDVYERNKIRHKIVEKMSEKERAKIIKECSSKSSSKIDVKSSYYLSEFLQFSKEEILFILDSFMTMIGEHSDISAGFIDEIIKAAKSKHCVQYKITESLSIEKNYDEINFVNNSKLGNYCFKFLGKFQNEFIQIDFRDGAKDRGIKNANEELILKNISPNDNYFINNYSKSVKRLFIDWKMPLFLRKVWPGIYDTNGKLLYIPRYRKTFIDNHTSKFKFDVEYFQKF